MNGLLRCRNWRAEAILRLLENNLAIAERPEELVVYAAHAKAARDHDSLAADRARADRRSRTATRSSSSPASRSRSSRPDRAPRRCCSPTATSSAAGRRPEVFYELERRGLTDVGRADRGLLAVHRLAGRAPGHLRDLRAGRARALRRNAARAARRHRRPRRHGRRAAGRDHADARAASALIAEVDAEKARARQAAGTSTSSARTIDEALAAALDADGPLAIAVTVNAAELLEGLLARGVTPDVATDLTAAHDLRTATCRSGVTLEEAADLRAGDPGKLESLALATMVRHVRALLELRERGAVVFDYGNNIRPHAAGAGLTQALSIDIFTARYLRPLFCRGIGPFRWICLSGEDADLDVLDELCLELFARRAADRATGSPLARAPRHPPGPARADRLARPRRAHRARPRRQRGRRERAAARAGRVHARPHGRRRDDPPQHHQRGDGRRLGRDQRLAAAERAPDDGERRRPRRAARGRRRLRRVLAERRDDGGRDGHRRRRRAPARRAARRHGAGGPAPRRRRLRGRAGRRARAPTRVDAVRELDLHAVHAAVTGGSILAAGGGGWVGHGMLVGTTAVQYGTPRLASLDEVDPDAMIATVSAIGAPAAKDWQMLPGDYVRALELLMDAVDEPIVGTVTAQNGSSTTCNGWVASAVLGTLVIDAAGDGRAHPTGKMGSFGLAADDELRDGPGGRRRQPRAGPLPRGRHARDRAPHGERPAHRLERVGRLHLRRAQPAAGVVRRRARRGRRDQLRARPRRGAARAPSRAARRR